MPFRGSSCLLCDLRPVFLILSFGRSTEVSPYLCYCSLFRHKPFLPFCRHVIRRAQTSWARFFSFSPWHLCPVPAILCMSFCGFDPISWLRMFYEEITFSQLSSFLHSSSVRSFTFRCRITASVPILHCVRLNIFPHPSSISTEHASQIYHYHFIHLF